MSTNKSKKDKQEEKEEESLKYEFKQNDEEEFLNPSLAVFPLNFPNLEMLNDKSQTNWKIGQNKERKLKSDKSLLGENSHIAYEARTKPNANKSSYYIGLLNRKHARDISIYDIDSIFCLNQKIKKLRTNNLELENDISAANKLDLMANFGTAKAARLAVNMKENLIKEGNISSVNAIKKVLKDKVNQSKYLKTEEEQEQTQLNFFKEILPEFDLNEKVVQNVFDFNSVINNQKIKEIDIEDILTKLKSKGNEFEKYKTNLTEYIAEYLDKKRTKIQEGLNINNKIKYAIYLNELINFFLLPKVIKDNIHKISEYTKINEDHLKIMLKKYTASNSENSNNKLIYIKNKNLILKNIYHILCLALLLESFEFNFTVLAKSMKVDNKQIMNYYREIGCTFLNSLENDKGEIIKQKAKNCVVKFTAPLKLNLKQKSIGKKNRK